MKSAVMASANPLTSAIESSAMSYRVLFVEVCVLAMTAILRSLQRSQWRLRAPPTKEAYRRTVPSPVESVLVGTFMECIRGGSLRARAVNRRLQRYIVSSLPVKP